MRTLGTTVNEGGAELVMDRRTRIALVAITVVALALRIAAAQGALWLDEAWSAVFAREAETVTGVFVAINHDNNHFANTLWLQATGWGAPPVLSRALSIFSGAAAVVVGGILNLRRGRVAALSAALILALSPVLVIYGSEARGYAPMLLGLLICIVIVDRWLSVRPFSAAPGLLGLAAAFGVLAHLTMIVGLMAISLWTAVRLAQRMSAAAAIAETLRLMRWAIASAAAILSIVAVVAIGNGGYRVGSVLPFQWNAFAGALEQLLFYSFGWERLAGGLPLAATAALVFAATLRVSAMRDRAALYGATILAFPAAIACLQVSNGSFPRYFLISALGLLLLSADLISAGFREGGLKRVICCTALAGFCLGSLLVDLDIVRSRRSDPGEALQAMIEREKFGTAVTVENPRSSAVLAAAAASRGYRLLITEDSCSGSPFLFADKDGATPLPLRQLRCGTWYERIAGRRLNGLSGLTWQLYARSSPELPTR
jgi:hypothetical protein